VPPSSRPIREPELPGGPRVRAVVVLVTSEYGVHFAAELTAESSIEKDETAQMSDDLESIGTDGRCRTDNFIAG
jgi:hypothetical protein